MRHVARWHPSTAAALIVFAGLIAHELVFHLSGGDDFPFQVTFDGTRVFVMSHGGLDALAVGALAISVLLLIDTAREHVKGTWR